jgi:Asp-tRNA(Asn)/Glu-tRNA(Gln) amidotransferase B subunit
MFKINHNLTKGKKMEISLKTKITLDSEQVIKIAKMLKLVGIIDDETISANELKKIIKQEMVFGSLKYLVDVLLDTNSSEQGWECYKLNNTIPNGYTKANSLDFNIAS